MIVVRSDAMMRYLLVLLFGAIPATFWGLWAAFMGFAVLGQAVITLDLRAAPLAIGGFAGAWGTLSLWQSASARSTPIVAAGLGFGICAMMPLVLAGYRDHITTLEVILSPTVLGPVFVGAYLLLEFARDRLMSHPK